MGTLVVIEGVDGAGKRTLADGVAARLRDRGSSVTQLAFPRYGVDVHADLVRDALYGRAGDLAGSVYGMAVLFALDRRGATADLEAARREHDVVLLDRYVASNAAYGAARLGQRADGEFVRWVRELEIDRFGIPVPDVQLLLRVPTAVATSRAAGRASTEPDRAPDSFESDDGLQRRCGERYQELAELGWLAPWIVVEGDRRPDLDAVVDRLAAVRPART